VVGDDTRFFRSVNTIVQIPSSVRVSTSSGEPQEEDVAFQDGRPLRSLRRPRRVDGGQGLQCGWPPRGGQRLFVRESLFFLLFDMKR
jgi:hypothetical protein